jgi:PAS domain S-box-containing protein
MQSSPLERPSPGLAGDQTNSRLAAIIESSDDAIIGKDLADLVTSWNQGAENMFGYTAGEIVGTSIMRLIPADRQEEERQILTRIRRGEKVKSFETTRQHKDGHLVEVSITASPSGMPPVGSPACRRWRATSPSANEWTRS